MNDDQIENEQMNNLPPEVTNILFNSDLDFYLMNLLAAHNLPDDQKMLVVLSTRALLVGDIAPNEFVKMISDVTGLDQANAALIAQEINRDVFNPVKDALKLVHSTPPVAVPTPYQVEAAAPMAVTPVVAQIPTPVPPVQSPAPAQPSMPTPPIAVARPVMPTPPPQSTQVVPPPNMILPPRMATVPAPVMPQPTIPTPPVANNLETKLGGTFTIKKEVMYTQPGTPAPLTPMPAVPQQMPTPQSPIAIPNPPRPQGDAPVVPLPQSGDPYRELPS